MKLLPLMLLAVCCSASAEWTLVGSSSRAEMYADLETIEKKQGSVSVWILTNIFDDPTSKSLASRVEYDCKQKRSRVLQEYRYSEHFMGGKNVSRDQTTISDDWLFAAPGTVTMNIINTLCKK